MSGLDELRQLLGAAHTHVDDAHAHAARARELLEQARETLITAQAVAQPWLPSQLPRAVDELDEHTARMTGVRELLNAYQARL